MSRIIETGIIKAAEMIHHKIGEIKPMSSVVYRRDAPRSRLENRKEKGDDGGYGGGKVDDGGNYGGGEVDDTCDAKGEEVAEAQGQNANDDHDCDNQLAKAHGQ